MKKKIYLRITTCLAAAAMMAALTACGGAKDEPKEEGLVMEKIDTTTGQPIANSGSDAPAADDAVSDQDEVAAVQATLTYMGGLVVKDNPASDMQFAMFRNEDGDLIGLVKEKDSFNYGIFTTEDAKLDDDTPYTKLTMNDSVYGYSFSDDLTKGILINEKGEKFDAVELDEDSARVLVRITITGE